MAVMHAHLSPPSQLYACPAISVLTGVSGPGEKQDVACPSEITDVNS